MSHTLKKSNMNTVKYEWCIEVMDGEDIADSSFFDSLSSFDKSDLEGNALVLVRNEGNEVEGVVNRLWAYVVNGELPVYFSNELGNSINTKVPQKFHKELASYFK